MDTKTRTRLIVGLFLAALSTAVVSWTALQLADILTAGRPADVGLGHALMIATRVLLHPSSPIPAGRDGSGLPSSAAFYAALLTLLLLPLLGAALALRRAGTTPSEAWQATRRVAERIGERFERREPERGARWAGRRDLRDLAVQHPTPGRLTLGIARGQLLATHQLHSTLLVGPSGSRKTTGLAIPALREWDGPVLATSVKTDLLDATIDARRARGPVLIYDPAGITGHRSDRWNPLHGCRTWATAARRANTLCRLAGGKQRHGDDFWYVQATMLLTAMFFAAAHDERPLADVIRWVHTQEDTEIRAALDRSQSAIARHTWSGSGPHRDPRLRDSIYATAQTALAAFTDEHILTTTTAPDITAAKLLHGPAQTLYLIAPVDRQEDLAPLFVLILDEIASALYAEGSSTPLDPSLLLLLDELANIAPIQHLDKLASTIRGHGGQLLSIIQDLAQLEVRYGHDTAKTIINNHHAKLILPGCADPLTLDWAAHIAGDEEIEQLSKTARSGTHDSTTRSTSFRPLAPAHSVRQQQLGEGLLVYGNLPATKIRLRSQG